MSLLIISLLLLAGLLNGRMDRVQFHYSSTPESKFSKWQSFFDPSLSWKNKWKNGDKAQGNKFPFSSTLLVSFTDYWHLLKSMMLWTLAIAFGLSQEYVETVYAILAARTSFGLGFILTYK